jgi:hypothetical protein
MIEGIEPSSFLAHIKKLFEEQGLSYESYQIDVIEFMSFSIINYDGKEIWLSTYASPDDRWLFIFGKVGNLGDFKSNEQAELILILLHKNMDTLGAKLALNDENDIVLMIATNNKNITYDELDDIIDNINFVSTEIYELLEKFQQKI